MFDVSEFMADQGCKPFPFKGVDGQVWELPHLGLLTADDAAALMAGDYSALEHLADEGTLEALNKVPALALYPLIHEWLNHCGMELDADGNPTGKFLKPSPSSPSTARSSRPTSRSGGSKTRKR